jgi:hypothetical protein
VAVTWPNYAALITLGGHYADATSDAQRSADVAAAQYPSALLTSTLEGIYSILMLSLGMLMIGLVMLNGVFAKVTAYIGVAAGALGIVSVAGPSIVPTWSSAVIGASARTTVWVVLVGFRLYRLG